MEPCIHLDDPCDPEGCDGDYPGCWARATGPVSQDALMIAYLLNVR